MWGETEKVYWPSHKHTDIYTRDVIKQLRENNISVVKVYNIIGSFFGSMTNIPFTKRALRGLCGKMSREQADNDVKKTMDVFAELGAKDSGLYYRVQPDVFAELGAKDSELSLSAADSQLSTGKDDPQAPGWTKRVRIGRAPIERAPCAGRVCALEKTLSGYAENKTDTIVVSVVGYNFDSLGEAYDFYNLYPWEIGFGIRYGKSRLNVERTKCMQEIVRGFSVSGN
ncbi:uncharacterized protein LOC125510856 [Triticum urartu]|uniref:Uncharacterized protein n=1 Tax=Triticum urartu TaxID=4572 RepID=A0A8R7UPL2_TRIUA|nr:uncharacterized protein LOC125510856 [Triticum urartu]XP_048532087.1 uncharacterized protein LOC125510856 [Triticum urartu]